MALPTRVQRGFVDPLDVIGREFDTVLNRFLNRGGDSGAPMQQYWASYGVDIREDADHLYVEADLPGFKKEEIDITLENQTLTITAEKKEEKEQKGEWLVNERRYAKFQRSFMLPPTVDDQKVDAKLTDGVLKITLNKREETKPRKISVG